MTDTTNPEAPEQINEEALPEVEEHDQSLLGSDSEEPEQTAEETDEIEVEGKKFSLPKSAAEKLKAERMMHADYTRKTQEVAEHRKAVEAQAAELQKQHQTQQQYLADVARVVSIDDQLTAYQQLDWDKIIADDPVEAIRLQNHVRMLEGKRAQALQVLAQKQQQNALNEQQAIAKQAQDAEAYFVREIPNWSPARSDQLMQFAISHGIPAQLVTNAVLNNPSIAKVLHKAELYDQMVKKQPPAPAPAPKPAAKVGQSAHIKKDPSEMTDAEFDAYRRRVRSNRK